jgi:hypothetical protein
MNNIPNKYLPKLNAKKQGIPIYKCGSKKIILTNLHQEKPFIISYDLSSYFDLVENEIKSINKSTKVKTYDTIPYNEIREGLFSDYLKYTRSDKQNNLLYPKNFKLIESQKTQKSNRLRHYALSLDESLFPCIKEFNVPYLEDFNYLMQLDSNFFEINQVISPHWLFIHPAYSVSNAHYDHDCVHTAIFQLSGSKYAQLISPEDHDIIRNKDFPLLPNGFNDFTCEELYNMRTDNLTIWEAVIEKNQILFIPCNWVHFVLGVTSGISYSQDIVLKNNFEKWLSSIFKSND